MFITKILKLKLLIANAYVVGQPALGSRSTEDEIRTQLDNGHKIALTIICWQFNCITNLHTLGYIYVYIYINCKSSDNIKR